MKNSEVEIDDEIEVDPMDTFTFDYDDIKKLFKDGDRADKKEGGPS
ncbi:MAG: hypothetical protein JSW39_23320 [Desulfobacterales bacterium]|nr:MAG: hypothetical protein JSW39_23320 [Desulfobacterales bacterium]